MKKGELTRKQPGSKGGRPTLKAEAYQLDGLLRAIRDTEQAKGMPLLRRFCEQAWDNHKAMAALVKKLIPDRQQIEIPINEYLEAIEQVYKRRQEAREREKEEK